MKAKGIFYSAYSINRSMPRVLLLNADWSPLRFITEIRAIGLLLKGRAEVITISDSPSTWGQSYETVSTSYQIPATVRLNSRVNVKQTPTRFRKKVLFNRDDWSCQYCLKKLGRGSVTIDHVIPKCKGGKTSWKNCVVCCKTCNKNKGPRSPQEAGMQLVKTPAEPRMADFWNLVDRSDWHEDWSFFVNSN